MLFQFFTPINPRIYANLGRLFRKFYIFHAFFNIYILHVKLHPADATPTITKHFCAELTGIRK